LGGRTPVIAVSPALLGRLTDRELDQVVLHEWAHVQRRDDVAQFVQQIVAAIFGLHPAVWWCARQIQLERELACDEYVVDATGSPKAYAACLAKLAAGRRRARSVAAPAAIARAQLTTRITRLLQPPTRYGMRRSAASLGAGALLVLATLGLAARVQLVAPQSFQFEGPPAPPASWPESAVADTVAQTVSASLIISPPPPAAGRRAVPRRTPRAISAPPLLRPTLGTDATNLMPRYTSPAEMASAILSPVQLTGTTARLATVPGRTVGMAAPSPGPDEQSDPAWSVAADAGIAVGRSSTKAARATAHFFTRMGKSIAGAM
jgi:hypothetical protein